MNVEYGKFNIPPRIKYSDALSVLNKVIDEDLEGAKIEIEDGWNLPRLASIMTIKAKRHGDKYRIVQRSKEHALYIIRREQDADTQD